MKQLHQASHKKSRLSIVVAIAMVGLFGLTTNSALADSNETGSTGEIGLTQSSISAGEASTCVIEAGAAKCWGNNTYGQLGNGSTTSSTTPVSVTGLSSGVTSISVGKTSACAVVSGAAKCWGDNTSGQLGNGSTTSSTTPVSVTGLSSGVTSVAVSSPTGSMYSGGNKGYACAVVSGAAKCWGDNTSGQLGNGSTTSSTTPVSVTGLTSDVTAISTNLSAGGMMSSGGGHTCAVVSGAAKCWGNNNFGQLGNSSTTSSTTPVSVTGLASGVTAISTGGIADYMSSYAHSCAVVSGAAKCWGNGSYGQLGDGGTNWSNTTPVSVTGLSTGVTGISAGGGHTCAVVSGAAKCWGNNNFGQLGNDSVMNSSTPASVSGLSTGVIAVTTGISHSCAATASAVKCWGSNANGQIGPSAFEVTQVSGLTSGVTDISTGNHSCAVVSDAAKCWGYNAYGQLGNGSNSNSLTPVSVSGLSSGVTSISTGDSHSCAVVSDAVKCWGYNYFGALGNGSTINVSTPVSVSGLSSGVTAISTGYNHSCALVSGAVKCWGYNYYGQLGDGGSGGPVECSGDCFRIDVWCDCYLRWELSHVCGCVWRCEVLGL